MPRVTMLTIMACPTISADIGDVVDVPIEMARELVKGGFAEEVDSLESKPAAKKLPPAASRASGQSDSPPAKDGDGSKEGAEESSKKAK